MLSMHNSDYANARAKVESNFAFDQIWKMIASMHENV